VFNRWRELLLVGMLSATAWASAQEGTPRDPTKPLNFRVQESSAPLMLNSILIGDGRRLAIINGEQLSEGSVIPGTSGVRLRRIQAQTVLLEQGDRRWRLSLPAAAKPLRASGTENN